MKTIAAAFLLLSCLCAVRGWDGGRRALQQQTSSSVSISVVGEGSASGRTQSLARSSSTTDSFVVSRAESLFTTAESLLGDGLGDQDEDDFCLSAMALVDAEARAVVTAQADAFASTSSEAEAEGNARVETSGEASARARAEEFGNALVQGAVDAQIGIRRAHARRAVRDEIDVFAEAFASTSTSAIVEGDGSASSSSTASSNAAVTAVARVTILLIAEVDCAGTYLIEDTTSTTDVLATEATATTGSGTASAGADADSTAVGDAGASSGVVDTN